MKGNAVGVETGDGLRDYENDNKRSKLISMKGNELNDKNLFRNLVYIDHFIQYI